MVINLEIIEQKAKEKQEENDAFLGYLKNISTEFLNETVHSLDHTISAQINCTTCGNCCKTLMINVEEDEATKAAHHLGITTQNFKEKFIEEGSSGMMIINKIPCHFLAENKCTIYSARFEGCKEFPGLHLPKVELRMFTVMMHYSRCPIVYNVIEQLKVETGFI